MKSEISPANFISTRRYRQFGFSSIIIIIINNVEVLYAKFKLLLSFRKDDILVPQLSILVKLFQLFYIISISNLPIEVIDKL